MTGDRETFSCRERFECLINRALGFAAVLGRLAAPPGARFWGS